MAVSTRTTTRFVGYGAGLLGIGFGNGFDNDFRDRIATLTFPRADMAE
jgi:hypothetical protein